MGDLHCNTKINSEFFFNFDNNDNIIYHSKTMNYFCAKTILCSIFFSSL